MKYFLIGLISTIALTFSSQVSAGGFHGHRAHAQHRHFHHHPHHFHRYHWVAPAIIGGAVTYAITRPYIVDQPIVVQQVPQSPVVHCTEWKEVLQPNGTIVQERTCNQQ